jgi:DNA polymerase-3 subunit alpha
MKIVGFEHLHMHSMYSPLDGYGTAEEYCERWQSHGDYLCLTDHGLMGGIPNLISTTEQFNKKKFKNIFGCELYTNPMHTENFANEEDRKKFIDSLTPEQKENFSVSSHILAIAITNKGYENLTKLCSLGWSHGFYRRPRVNHEFLETFKEGIIFTSCCCASEAARALSVYGEEKAEECIIKYKKMFGAAFFLEMMLLDFEKQKPYNKFLIKMHEKHKLPMIISNDVHYANKEDSHYQTLMLLVNSKKTLAEIEQLKANNVDVFELQDRNLWMKTEEEINEMYIEKYSDVIPIEIFEEAKLNTVKIAREASNVKIDRSVKLPKIYDDEEKLKDLVLQGLKKRGISKTNTVYFNRVIEELDLIFRKQFASYFLIVKSFTDEARRVCKELTGLDGKYAVGAGRGSGVGSLVLYLLEVTDVDPIKHGLLFSRFLSENRGSQAVLKFST